jgi:dihydrofolate reductase
MGAIVVHEFMTLDGVVQAPGGPDEDSESGFEHGGWQAPYFDDEGESVADRYAPMDALLLGRKTYEIFAGYWPNGPADSPFTALLNEIPKYVASRTLDRVDWNNSTLLEGDAAEAVPPLKERYGQIHVAGSADLVQTLLRHDLVDRLNLWIYPLLLGTGKRLFGDGTVPAAFRLADSRIFPGGAVYLGYEAAGKPTYGDMTVETQ